MSNLWTQTRSGRAFDFLEMSPDDVNLGDIAYHLSHINRYNGAAGNYSVAQHSYLVSLHLPIDLALEGLLHDATEAYLGDIIYGVKEHPYVDEGICQLEHEIRLVIAAKFGLAREVPVAVKRADLRMLMTEKRDLLCDEPRKWPITPKAFPPYNEPVHIMHPEVAFNKFLERARQLLPIGVFRNEMESYWRRGRV